MNYLLISKQSTLIEESIRQCPIPTRTRIVLVAPQPKPHSTICPPLSVSRKKLSIALAFALLGIFGVTRLHLSGLEADPPSTIQARLKTAHYCSGIPEGLKVERKVSHNLSEWDKARLLRRFGGVFLRKGDTVSVEESEEGLALVRPENQETLCYLPVNLLSQRPQTP